MKKSKIAITVVIIVIIVLAAAMYAVSHFKSTEACEHENTNWRIVTEASCVAEGKRENVCLLCNAVVNTEKINKLPHTEIVDKAIAATCTTEGRTAGKHCSVCSTVLVAPSVIPALSHDKVMFTASAPTCESAGWDEYFICNRCDYSTYKSIPALGHNIASSGAVAPTCTASGLTAKSYCNRCQETIQAQEIIPALGHDEAIDARTPETCTRDGLTEGKHCRRCSVVLISQTTIPASGHIAVIDAAINPTCSKTGLTEGSHCKKCNEVLVAQKQIPKSEHKIVSLSAVAPTCTKSGLSEGSSCSVCNAIIKTQTIKPALGHSFDMRSNKCIRCDAKEYAEIASRNDLLAYDSSHNVVIYLEKCITTSDTSEFWTLPIQPDATYVRLVGAPNTVYNICIEVKGNRESSLTIDLVDVTLKSIKDAPVITANCKTPLNIGFYGEACKLIGKNGENGAAGGIWNLNTMNGDSGKAGNMAIKASCALNLYVASENVEIVGGNGGNGGRGQDAVPAPMGGGDGGKGGDGAYAISASSIDIYGRNGHSSNSVVLKGGAGGTGGAGGDKFLVGSNGWRGADGKSAVATTIAPTYH